MPVATGKNIRDLTRAPALHGVQALTPPKA
jgi:hypothetical protein